ncbi:MAG: sensor histidine kinase [Thermoleophilia bacterium]
MPRSPRLGDLWIALAGGALGAAGSIPWPPSAPPAAAIVTGGLLGAALGLARWAPEACWAAAAALLLACGLAGTLPGGDDTVVAYILGAAHAFAAGRFAGRRSGIVGAVALTAAGIAGSALTPGGTEVVFLFIVPASWGAGRALRERSEAAAQLAQRARELEAEREAYAALSVRYERARIASELHDIVAHAISVMVVQATAGQRLVGRDPAATAETFANIADAARQAEREMGLLVGLLADEAAPSPDLALVEELVSRAAGSGLDVTLTLRGEREGLPPAIAAVAYRVVQEGLTNALRYAAGSAVAVTVDGRRDAVSVEVVNGPAGRGPALGDIGGGTGLRGLRERAEALGGTLEAGPRDGGWRLAARLPVAGALGLAAAV